MEKITVESTDLSEDEQRQIEELLASLPDSYKKEWDSFVKKLHEFGSKAASFILEKAESTESNYEIFKLINNLEYTATSSDAERIGALLEKEVIANNNDRSNKHILLNILKRVGVLNNVPQLKRYVEMSFDTDYGVEDRFGQDSFNRWDAIDALQVLFYIRNGDLEMDDDGRHTIDEAIDHINKRISEKGFPSLSAEALATISYEARREELVKRFNRNFEEKQPSVTTSFDDELIADEFDDPFSRRYADREVFEEELDPEKFLKTLRSISDNLLGKGSKEDGNDASYHFFNREIERKELFEYCKKIAEYLHDEDIRNFVVVDRSSRPVYIGVREYWRYKYPDEKSPNVFFMNPSGFKSKDEKGKDWKVDAPKQVLKTRVAIVEEFQRVYSGLAKDKDKPVLVFDSCIHSGNTLLPIRKTMEQAGFEDIRIGSINKNDSTSTVKTDFHVTDERPEKGCYPFDRDRMIEKVFYSLYSQRSSEDDERARSVRLREEICRIIEEKIREDAEL